MAYLRVTLLQNAGPGVQVWMASPFEIYTWYAGLLTSEKKGDELNIKAGYKLDLAAPAWVNLVGLKPGGVWVLSAEPKSNEQAPAPGFVAVTGPALVEVASEEPPPQPPPVPEPPLPTPEPPETDPGQAPPAPEPPPATRPSTFVVWRRPMTHHIPSAINVAVDGDLFDSLLDRLVEVCSAQLARGDLDKKKV